MPYGTGPGLPLAHHDLVGVVDPELASNEWIIGRQIWHKNPPRQPGRTVHIQFVGWSSRTQTQVAVGVESHPFGVACFPNKRIGRYKPKLVRRVARTIPNFREGCTIDRDVLSDRSLLMRNSALPTASCI